MPSCLPGIAGEEELKRLQEEILEGLVADSEDDVDAQGEDGVPEVAEGVEGEEPPPIRDELAEGLAAIEDLIAGRAAPVQAPSRPATGGPSILSEPAVLVASGEDAVEDVRHLVFRYQRLRSLDLPGTVDFVRLSGLEVLSLSHNELRDLEPLRPLVALREVNLNFNQVEDLSPLFECEQLTKAFVAHNRIRSIAGLECGCGRLEELSLLGNQLAADTSQEILATLAALPHLRALDVAENEAFRLPMERQQLLEALRPGTSLAVLDGEPLDAGSLGGKTPPTSAPQSEGYKPDSRGGTSPSASPPGTGSGSPDASPRTRPGTAPTSATGRVRPPLPPKGLPAGGGYPAPSALPPLGGSLRSSRSSKFDEDLQAWLAEGLPFLSSSSLLSTETVITVQLHGSSSEAKNHERQRDHRKSVEASRFFLQEGYGYAAPKKLRLLLRAKGDYVELGDVIGTGAQGQVFACRREKSDARLAAKVVDCHRLQLSADEPEIVVKKMENEVRILRNAEHEHCVSLYDIYRTPRWIVLIMERLEGGELFEQIAKKRTLKELEAKHVFQQIVSGLVFLHGKKIAHRDLKPENVLIAKMRQADPPNEDCTLYDIKIADYGLSKYNDEGEPLRSMVGTPQYWAPEMLKAKGRQGYDERVDLWSLGVLLYVMLYGRYPFRGDNANEQIKNGTFELSRVKSPPSEDAQDLIRKLLKVNPGDRLPLSGCLEHPWLVGEKKKAPSPPQPASAVAVRAVTPRAPFDLRELLRLQVSLGRSLEIACLACRSQHPELAASIRETIMQAQLLWQQAVKVIGQYAQVSRKVIETVLPDLNLAVQESVPELGYDLLSMVESWIQKMTADSEKMHWLCTELSKHLEKMIHQAQAQQLQLQAAAPEARAPQPPNAICDAGSQATPHRRQDLFDELELFANKISRGTYSDVPGTPILLHVKTSRRRAQDEFGDGNCSRRAPILLHVKTSRRRTQHWSGGSQRSSSINGCIHQGLKKPSTFAGALLQEARETPCAAQVGEDFIIITWVEQNAVLVTRSPATMEDMIPIMLFRWSSPVTCYCFAPELDAPGPASGDCTSFRLLGGQPFMEVVSQRPLPVVRPVQQWTRRAVQQQPLRVLTRAPPAAAPPVTGSFTPSTSLVYVVEEPLSDFNKAGFELLQRLGLLAECGDGVHIRVVCSWPLKRKI
ncbi:fhkC [Symbiodinium sp. CCMP2592]|nr:fhkC [Symbiodinium sp. CCMP2592]